MNHLFIILYVVQTVVAILALKWTFSLIAHVVALHAHAIVKKNYEVSTDRMFYPALLWGIFYFLIMTGNLLTNCISP